MRTSADCVWEEQHIWNIPGGLKKVIAGVVTVSLLGGIGDAVSMVPLQEEIRPYAATSDETIRWSVPIRLGQMVKQESMRIYTLAEMEKHVQIDDAGGNCEYLTRGRCDTGRISDRGVSILSGVQNRSGGNDLWI